MGVKSALFFSAESPYPTVGGGALRAASLLEYLAQDHAVDVIVFRQPGDPDPRTAFPPEKARRVWVIDLPFHSKSTAARALRNGLRFLRGSPPLLDRFSGFQNHVDRLLAGANYELGSVEHFWCAPYVEQLRPHCRSVWIDLVDIESVWHERIAPTTGSLQAVAHRRFAAAYRQLEARLLPRFDRVLVTSANDAELIRPSAGAVPIIVYPNALPFIPTPAVPKRFSVVFSGNLEYQPNIAAIYYFRSEIWPLLRERWPGLEWEIIGKNPHSIANLVEGDASIRLVGPVADAILTIAQSQVAVVPLLAGSGTRVKILEAWAAATPVISTTIGAEGLNCSAGEHLLIADSPRLFAEGVSTLLASEGERRRIGQNGRRNYETLYTWAAAWTNLAF